ncbi:sporulation-delaying protein SdpB family protein [Paenibacillus sp. KS-LC4]|uniref:sporulation-delaying protein SdpB family protein n=1 Tax=Paenibacillus sp. KS-LC4 TaxID=2979727 RepID=UPI0030CE52BB
MFSKVGEFAHKLAINTNPWTNVYGFARSLLAVATAMTLALNDARIFFRPSSGSEIYPNCQNTLSLFCTVPNDYFYLNIVRWIAVLLLIIVASGWRPRFTGIIHWWIAYSLNVSALTLDGGEQVNTVLTLLLLPITLLDSRKWHWKTSDSDTTDTNPLGDQLITKRIIAIICIFAIRFQVAILYLHSSIAKIFEPTWVDGTAVYYYLSDPMLGLPSLLLDLVNPILTSPLVAIVTWGTLVLQMCLFGALFAPKKHWIYYLYAALFLHEIIALMLGLISFSISMSAALILYLVPVERELTFFKKLNFFKKRNQPTTSDYTLEAKY